MYNVSTEVDTQTNAGMEDYVTVRNTDNPPDDDDVHAGDVNGQSPPVHEATHIDAREKDAP